MNTTQVLLIEDDDALRHSLAQAFDLEGLRVIQASSFDQARRAIRANFNGIILSDIRMPGKDGFDLLRLAQDIDPTIPVILLTGEADIPMALKAMREGAYDFLEKPCKIDYLTGVVFRALGQRNLVLRNRKIERDLARNDIAAVNFPGSSDVTKNLRREIRLAAEQNSHIHLFGPKGAGRRIASHTIHKLSEGCEHFISLSVLSEDWTMVNELLHQDVRGDILFKKLECADRGTQAKIINILDNYPHIRIMTSSTESMSDLYDNGFMTELCSRLDQLEIKIPALSSRKPDIPAIFESLVRQAVRNLNLDMPDISQQSYAEVMARNWPQNLIDLRSFANAFALGRHTDSPYDDQPTLAAQMESFEKLLLVEALKKHQGQAGLAAKDLGLPRKTFYDRLSRYGIKPKDYA